MSERIVDRNIPRLLVLDEEDGIGDAVEEFDAGKRTPKDRGERHRRVGFHRRLRDFADFQFPTRLFIKNREPRHANIGLSECPTLGSHKMPSQVFSGTMPALMTPCGPARRPDFDALVKMGKHLIDSGMSGLIYCGSMGRWRLLTLENAIESAVRP